VENVLRDIIWRTITAEHQSRLLQKLRQDDNDRHFQLTLKEHQILNRGRNAASSRNHNHRRNPIIYQDSTSFEAIIGYLYISDPVRCTELFQWIDANVDNV
jgi:ribonuclease III family protein